MWCLICLLTCSVICIVRIAVGHSLMISLLLIWALHKFLLRRINSWISSVYSIHSLQYFCATYLRRCLSLNHTATRNALLLTTLREIHFLKVGRTLLVMHLLRGLSLVDTVVFLVVIKECKLLFHHFLIHLLHMTSLILNEIRRTNFPLLIDLLILYHFLRRILELLAIVRLDTASFAAQAAWVRTLFVWIISILEY